MKTFFLCIILGVACNPVSAGSDPEPYANTINDDFAFEIEGRNLPVGAYAPFVVKVHLKRDFKGTAKFFSCDPKQFMLLDDDAGEFVASHTYKINAKAGYIGKFSAEFYGDAAGSVPLICGKVIPSADPWEKRYYARLTNTEILQLDAKDDWYDTHIMEALPQNIPFVQARTEKLLTKYYSKEKAESLLPELVSWISENFQVEVADRSIRWIVDKYGGKTAAQALVPALDSPSRATVKKTLQLLNYCGEDKKVAFDAIKKMLHYERDGDMLRELVVVARDWGLDVPPKLLEMGDISEKDAAAYKERIFQACDRAAKVDLTQKEQYPHYYDKGGRIPSPPDAARSIKELEELVDTMPNYPEMARAYLLLGRLMQRFENFYSWADNPQNPYDHTPPEIKNKMFEYQDGEPGAVFYYNGYHFDRLISLFPNSEYADDAAFEKTKVLYGGESEGDEVYCIWRQVGPYFEFLNGYPASDLAGNAIDAINDELKRILARKDYRLTSYEGFSVEYLKSLIKRYQEVAEKVAIPQKVKAYDTICALWEKTGEDKKAIQTCGYILENYPQYSRISSVQRRAEMLKVASFELKTPNVAGYLLVELEWEPVNTAVEYSIYRSTEGDNSFVKVGISSTSVAFQDRTISPATSYIYYVEANNGASGLTRSNQVTAQIPATNQKTYALSVFFNRPNHSLYIFGRMLNPYHEGVPEYIRVSNDGNVSRSFTGSFYGYPESVLDKYADGITLIDPIHQAFLHFSSETELTKSMRIITTQDMEISPYGTWKWAVYDGKYNLSIGRDMQSIWRVGSRRSSWEASEGEHLAWDSENDVCWETRGKAIIRYDSSSSKKAHGIYPGKEHGYKALYPDEQTGDAWAVGRSGYFYRVSLNSAGVRRFQKSPIAMPGNVAFDTVNNYAWIINVAGEDSPKLRKVSLADGQVIKEVQPEVYMDPEETLHGNSAFLSLDRDTGNLWIYNADCQKVVKLSPEGARLMSLKV